MVLLHNYLNTNGDNEANFVMSSIPKPKPHVYPFRINIYKPNGENGPSDVEKHFTDGNRTEFIKGMTSLAMRQDIDLVAWGNSNPAIETVWMFHADAKTYTIFTHAPKGHKDGRFIPKTFRTIDLLREELQKDKPAG